MTPGLEILLSISDEENYRSILERKKARTSQVGAPLRLKKRSLKNAQTGLANSQNSESQKIHRGTVRLRKRISDFRLHKTNRWTEKRAAYAVKESA